MRHPNIKGPNSHDFHDSALLSIEISNGLDEVTIVLCTGPFSNFEGTWQVKFKGVLQFCFETLGAGRPPISPIDIYDIYYESNSSVVERWRRRFMELGGLEKEIDKIRHVTLASAAIRGWGENQAQEGALIVCQGFEVSRISLT